MVTFLARYKMIILEAAVKEVKHAPPPSDLTMYVSLCIYFCCIFHLPQTVQNGTYASWSTSLTLYQCRPLNSRTHEAN